MTRAIDPVREAEAGRSLSSKPTGLHIEFRAIQCNPVSEWAAGRGHQIVSSVDQLCMTGLNSVIQRAVTLTGADMLDSVEKQVYLSVGYDVSSISLKQVSFLCGSLLLALLG